MLDAPLYESVANCLKKYLLNLSLAQEQLQYALSEVLKLRKGVCQDFTHLIASLRSIGFAARYVSGYLETLLPKGKQNFKDQTLLMRGSQCMCLKWVGV
jgi:hypothetical protein